MYEELIKQMRSVYQEIDCPDCPLAKDCMKLQGVCAFTRAADAIEKLTDNHVGKWIPVTERLPEICERDVNGNITFSEKVWSCIDCGDGFYWQQTDQYTTNCGGGWMSEVPEDGFTPKVVAWMPLPEPYEVK